MAYTNEEKKNAILVIDPNLRDDELNYSFDCRGVIAYCSEEYYNKAVEYWRNKNAQHHESEGNDNEK